MSRLLGVLVFLVQVLSAEAEAHELRPAFLDMKEISAEKFAVLWKVPSLGEQRLRLNLRLPETCKDERPPVASEEDNYVISRWSVSCGGGLKGGTIAIDGLRTTLTDVLARIEYVDGTSEVTRLTPEKTGFAVTGQMNWLETAETYFRLGVDHILSGVDHLLFVLVLMLLIRERWMLLKTITAFTVAHSITLAGASLGYFSLPQKPVEATIALSIAFVASELVKMKSGERRLSEAYPWLVAFAFGLLHGFGFAGALREIGLPQIDVPTALLMFNVGVEAGQLLFIAAVLIAFGAMRALVTVPIAPARLASAYLIGTTATVWLVTRLHGFLS
jgi:hydrogenase/urease accessory protein HupE